MTTLGLFYGSTTGNTQNAAQQIKAQLGDALSSVQDIGSAKAETLMPFDVLILGTSTWGYGEEQDDWLSFNSELAKVDWSNKRVALFGLGDQVGYSDTYLDAMGILYDAITKQGAQVIGQWDTEGYEFEDSKARREDRFVGLALDDDNQASDTEARIAQWVSQLKIDLGL